MKSLTLLAIIFPISILNSFAQDCTVEMLSLKGSYTGECKKGKAEGIGKSVGTDTYEGNFKSGLPNGEGTYTWANGNLYKGGWNKGFRSGKGTMIFKTTGGTDSVLVGFWKKDIYVGLYENPYVIHSRTVHVTGVSMKFVNNTRNQFEIFIDSETANRQTGFAEGAVVAKPEITNVELITGTFQKRVENNAFTKKIGYTFEDVTYPFRAKITIGMNDVVEIELLEAGRWTIDVRTSF